MAHVSAGAPRMTTGVTPRSGIATMRILMLDDDEIDRRAVRRALLKAGVAATLDEATTTAELLRQLDPATHDCVLLDYHVPGVDSLALLRQARRVAPEIPVIMLTGRGDEELAVELMKAGAADYLVKAGLTPERLSASIRHAIELSREAGARRRAEEELRTQEAHFRTLANAIPQLAWIADRDGRRSWYNDRCYEFSGLTFDDLRDYGWHRLHHPDHLARVRAGQRAAFEHAEVWEDSYPLRRRDGVYRWFLSRAVPIRGERGDIVRWLGTNTDITERREAEEAVRESEAKLRRISDSGIVGVFYWTLGGLVTEANEQFSRMLGWSLDDVRAGAVNVRALTPPEWHEVDAAKEGELRTRGTAMPWEKELYAKDGRRVPVIVGAALLEGQSNSGVAVCLDITRWKEVEVERERLLALEQALRSQAERATKARDEIVAVVAHDLRDPVHTIAMAASNMLEIPLAPHESVRQLEVLKRAARRMERLISDLLDVSRMESGQFAIETAALELPSLLDETVEAFDLQAAPRGITLTADSMPNLPPVVGDHDRLAQVLSNLVGNALKFTPAGGSIRLRAVQVGSAVEVSVEDTGSGIPAEQLPHIFERFWQAQRASRSGAGLGLAIAKGIIEAHGGRIWAESAAGRGTTVRFTVPCVR